MDNYDIYFEDEVVVVVDKTETTPDGAFLVMEYTYEEYYSIFGEE